VPKASHTRSHRTRSTSQELAH